MVAKALPAELLPQAERIVAALGDAACRILDASSLDSLSLSNVSFSRVIDPGNQMPGFEGIWRNGRNARCGSIIFNSDGSFYAEYDLFVPHPDDARWFIEMVTAWGRGDCLRAELQMIPSM